MKRFRPAARSPHATRASGDRWLFGYADIVTLLFACFASLYATRNAPAASTAPEAPPAPQQVELAAPESDLERTLATRVVRAAEPLPGLEVTSSARGVVISLPEAGSFPPGGAELSPVAQLAILNFARALRDLPNAVRVEGHTDDVPISTSEFSSNWDLSTARATRVVRLLVEEAGIAPSRLAAAGYGEYQPRIPNDSPESRARNRRVDIVVLDTATAASEVP